MISTDDSSILSGPYRLRAKFIDGSPYGFHAATSYQNNGAKLDSLPPPGTYGVALYWVTYTDYTYSTVAQIGPETDATVTVDNTFSFAMDTTQLAAYALDPQGGLSAFHVIVYLDGGGDILADGAPYSGNYEWSVTGSVSSSGSGNVDLSATGTSGSYSAPEFYYNNSGCFVDVP
ncbi:MAG TPA: hypothetical protein VHE61_22915 [Opitutaceae bacterium]|nr:hypothetical protein [Opitutaceae bacterium]